MRYCLYHWITQKIIKNTISFQNEALHILAKCKKEIAFFYLERFFCVRDCKKREQKARRFVAAFCRDNATRPKEYR